MNGFQTRWRFMSAQDRASTIGKKTANWIVGKTMCVYGRPREARLPRADPSESSAQSAAVLMAPRRQTAAVWIQPHP